MLQCARGTGQSPAGSMFPSCSCYYFLMKKIITWMAKPTSRLIVLVASSTIFIMIGAAVGLNSSEWASWVQAVGSIGAIVGSFALARHESREADKMQKTEDLFRALNLAQAAETLAGEVENELRESLNKMRNASKRRRPISTERMNQIQRALETFTHRDLSPLLLKQILILQRETAYSLTAVREMGTRNATVVRIHNAEMRLLRVESCRYQINGQIGDFAKRLTQHFSNS